MSRLVLQPEMNFRVHGGVELQFENLALAPRIEKFGAGGLNRVAARRVGWIRKTNGRFEGQEKRFMRRHDHVERGVARMRSARGCSRRQNFEGCVRGVCREIREA